MNIGYDTAGLISLPYKPYQPTQNIKATKNKVVKSDPKTYKCPRCQMVRTNSPECDNYADFLKHIRSCLTEDLSYFKVWPVLQFYYVYFW